MNSYHIYSPIPSQSTTFEQAIDDIGPHGFIVKVTPQNQVSYATLIGGTGGSTSVNAVTVDSSGNIYVAGGTTTPNLPVVAAAQPHLAGGTLLKSTDGGSSWAVLPFPDSAPTLVTDPNNPMTLYGCSAAVYRSIDGGLTWRVLEGAGCPLIDPTNSNALYSIGPTAGTGVVKSSDGGTTWASAGLSGQQVTALAMDTTQPQTLYAGLSGGALYRSADGGGSWAQIGGNTLSVTSIDSITVDPCQGRDLYVKSGFTILKSSDQGASWTALVLTINGYAYTQAFATKAFVDPLNCSNVYAGAYGIGVYASHDGGATPVALYSLPLGMPPSGFVFDPDTAGTVYAASPASNLYMQLYGSSGYGYSYPIAVPSALLRTTNTGATWTTVVDGPGVDTIAMDKEQPPALYIGMAVATDGFVIKLDPSGSKALFATYVGGIGDDTVNAIAVNKTGTVAVVGETHSPDFPVLSNAFQQRKGGGGDAFIAEFGQDGSVIGSSFLGGLGEDTAQAVSFDTLGNLVIAGWTQSADLPVAYPAQGEMACGNCASGFPGPSDAFLAQVDPSVTTILELTYLGGDNSDYAFGLAVDSGGAWIGGTTDSVNFPTTQGALQSGPGEADFVTNGFFAKIPIRVVPSISSGGVVNAASYAARTPVAPGSIAAVFGGFPVNSPAMAPGAPWPTDLGGLSMQFGTVQAPLYYASGEQANLQVPWEVAGQTQSPVTAAANGQASPAQSVNLAPFAPGVFAMNGQGTGQGAILDTSYRLVDASNPAIAGSTYVSIYCTGLGPVTNQPASGSASPSNPLAATTTNPTVTIGGATAQFLWAGLAPGFVGLYQVNVLVPAATPSGTAVPVVVSTGGSTSNTVTIAVK
jgi:uncharacterized protein (TIGR03437 family)